MLISWLKLAVFVVHVGEIFEEEMLARSAIKVKVSADATQFFHANVAIQKENVTSRKRSAAS